MTAVGRAAAAATAAVGPPTRVRERSGTAGAVHLGMPRLRTPAESDWELRQRLTLSLSLRAQRSLESIPAPLHWPRRDAATTAAPDWAPGDSQSSTKWRKATTARAAGTQGDRERVRLREVNGVPETLREMSREFWTVQSAFAPPTGLLSSADARCSPRPISGPDEWGALVVPRTPRAPATPRPARRLMPMLHPSGPSWQPRPPPGAQPRLPGSPRSGGSSRVSPRSLEALRRGEATIGAVAAWHTAPAHGRGTEVLADGPQED